MIKFKIGSFITLKLEDNKTNIYLKDNPFYQCKSLFLVNPIQAVYKEASSIDDIVGEFDQTSNIEIDPKQEFWGHCSNLQSWYEHKYDTKLLHSNLAFPLLEELYLLGDIDAKRVFKEELVRRLSSGNINVFLFLYEGKYLEYLEEEELVTAFQSLNTSLIFGELFGTIKIKNHNDQTKTLIVNLFNDHGIMFIGPIIILIRKSVYRNNLDDLLKLIDYNIFEVLKKEHFKFFSFKFLVKLLKSFINIIKIFNYKDDRIFKYIFLIIKVQANSLSSRHSHGLVLLKDQIQYLRKELKFLELDLYAGVNDSVYSIYVLLNYIEYELLDNV